MADHTFVETDDLGVHLVSPGFGAEFTLCGDAFDMAGSENIPDAEWRPTRKRTVTCPKCALIIEHCRGVRTAATGEG